MAVTLFRYRRDLVTDGAVMPARLIRLVSVLTRQDVAKTHDSLGGPPDS